MRYRKIVPRLVCQSERLLGLFMTVYTSIQIENGE